MFRSNVILTLLAALSLNATAIASAPEEGVVKVKPLKIKAKTKTTKEAQSTDDIQSFSNKTLLLEQVVDQHATNVQMNRQRLIESSQIDHMLQINAVLQDVEHIYFRTLDLRLDGFPLFSVNEGTGLWTPTSELPLYSGPVTPGDHEIKISAKISHQTDPGNELADAKLSYLEDTAKFTVAIDQKQKSISLVIAKASDGTLTLVKPTAP